MRTEDTTGRSTTGAPGGNVVENYDQLTHSYSTRTAEGFEAIERTTREYVLLWLLRYPLSEQSDARERFVRRLQSIAKLGVSGIPQFRTFGVDNLGNAYLVLQYVRGHSLLETGKSLKERQRLFAEILAVTATLHHHGIIMGDLASDSFLLTDEGRVMLTALLGSFDSEARQTAMLPPPETLHYLSPEQRTGSGPEFASDIYALGVLGYRLFTGSHLCGDRPQENNLEDPASAATAPSVLRNELPFWIDDIIGKCLESRAEDRFSDAGELLSAFRRAMHTGATPCGPTSRWSRGAVIVRPADSRLPRRPVDNYSKEKKARTESRPEKESRSHGQHAVGQRAARAFAWVLLLIFGVAIGALLFIMFEEGERKTQRQTPIAEMIDYAPTEMRPLIIDLSSESMPLAQKQEALRKIGQGDDPISYAVLIAVVKGEADGSLKKLSQDLLLDRVRKQQLLRSAGVLANWFKVLEQNRWDATRLPVFTALLNACDATRPLDSRHAALRKAYESEPVIALELTTALVLDSGAKDDFLPVLRQLLATDSERLNLEDLQNKGIGALILSNKALTLFFDDDVRRMIDQFTMIDLQWSLQQLAEFETPVFGWLVKEVLRRGELAPTNRIFVEALDTAAPDTMDAQIRWALVRSAFGTIGTREVGSLGRWTMNEAERPLLACCILASDAAVAVEAFDMLAGRTLITEPAAGLMKWIRSYFWDYRQGLARAVGILGLSDLASEEQLRQAFQDFTPFTKGGSFLRVLIAADKPKLIVEGLQRFAEITPSEEILPLLSNADPQVRIAAVRSFEGRNALGVLQGLLRAYDREEDLEVCRVYHEKHWVTIGRKSRCNELLGTVKQDA